MVLSQTTTLELDLLLASSPQLRQSMPNKVTLLRYCYCNRNVFGTGTGASHVRCSPPKSHAMRTADVPSSVFLGRAVRFLPESGKNRQLLHSGLLLSGSRLSRVVNSCQSKLKDKGNESEGTQQVEKGDENERRAREERGESDKHLQGSWLSLCSGSFLLLTGT